ncbi:MAG: hypothetical protein AAGI38_18825 [Bacteroidota bacterium]
MRSLSRMWFVPLLMGLFLTPCRHSSTCAHGTGNGEGTTRGKPFGLYTQQIPKSAPELQVEALWEVALSVVYDSRHDTTDVAGKSAGIDPNILRTGKERSLPGSGLPAAPGSNGN